MKEIIWSNVLSVDVKEIDEDHRRLVELFNILNRSVAQEASTDYIEAVMDELVSCTAWHFKHEERLMLEHNFGSIAEHRAEHHALIESAEELRQKFMKEGRRLSHADIEFLEHWLTGHILGADMELGAYLAKVM